MTATFGNGLWHLIAQSDALTKFILLGLFFMNVLCTAVFLYKLILARIKQRELHAARSRLKSVTSIDDLRLAATELAHTWPGYLIKRTLATIKSSLERHPMIPTLTANELALVEHTIEQSVDELLHAEQSYMPILFSSAAVSPLIGLFGTIWGLIHAFVRISQRQSADIATVAPGIAEALITTLAGLCVAIPVLMMYHYLLAQARSLEHQLLIIADQVDVIVCRLFAHGDRS